MKLRVLLSFACFLLISSAGLAQKPQPKSGSVTSQTATNCSAPIQIPADGTSAGFVDSVRILRFYTQYFAAGHSYSVEIWDPFDPGPYTGGGGIGLGLVVVDSATCNQPAAYTDTAPMTPKLDSLYFADRVSWIQPTTASQSIAVDNYDISPHSYYIRLTDTTLYNPRWSTYSGFTTQYAFVNLSNAKIQGTLTVFDHTSTQSNPIVLAAVNITVPAGGEYFFTVSPNSSPSVPANHFGFATFAFVGPPGAIRADADTINSNASIIVPSTFGPISEPH